VQGWSLTSAGPLLLPLTVAAAIGKPVYGAGIALAYAVGRGLLFLLPGLFAAQVGAWVARVEHYRRAAEVVSGITLVGLSGSFVCLATALA